MRNTWKIHSCIATILLPFLFSVLRILLFYCFVSVLWSHVDTYTHIHKHTSTWRSNINFKQSIKGIKHQFKNSLEIKFLGIFKRMKFDNFESILCATVDMSKVHGTLYFSSPLKYAGEILRCCFWYCCHCCYRKFVNIQTDRMNWLEMSCARDLTLFMFILNILYCIAIWNRFIYSVCPSFRQ